MNSFRKKPLSELVSLFHIRELAKSNAERVALTEIIAVMFDSVGHPLVQVQAPSRSKPEEEPDGLDEVVRSEPESWIWYVEKLLADIDAGAYRHPYKFECDGENLLLCVRIGHWLEHIRRMVGHTAFRRMKLNRARMLTVALEKAAILLLDDNGNTLTFERTLLGRRVSYMVAISMSALTTYGIAVPTRQTARFIPKVHKLSDQTPDPDHDGQQYH